MGGWLKTVTLGLAATFVIGALQNAGAASAPAQTAPAAPGAQAPQGRTIFDYKADLSLTDRQEREIKNVLTELNKRLRLDRARLTLLDSEVEELIIKEADLEQLRRKLREIADLQVNLRIADIEATRKINRTLSPEQLKRWRSIQEAARTRR